MKKTKRYRNISSNDIVIKSSNWNLQFLLRQTNWIDVGIDSYLLLQRDESNVVEESSRIEISVNGESFGLFAGITVALTTIPWLSSKFSL